MSRRLRFLLRSLARASACLALAAACDSGGSATASGGTRPTLAASWAMRRDVRQASDVLSDVRAADLDGDGLADLIQANSVGREFLVSFGTPDGRFGAPVVLPSSGVPWRSEVGDLDGDGLADIATLCRGGVGASAAVEVFLQGPPGAFAPKLTRTLHAEPDDLALAPASGLAGDTGRRELFVALSGERRVARVGLVSGALSEIESLDSESLGYPGAAFSVASFDEGADGTLDLAVAEVQVQSSELGRVLVYPRQGTGFGAPVLAYYPVYWPTVDNVGDVDRDGTDDLAVAQVDDDDVLLRLGSTSGSPAIMPVSFGPGATSAVFTDLDKDGKVDAATAAFEQAAVWVRMGTGQLSWGEPVRYDAGFLPRSLAALELPGDDLPDLVVANVFTVGLLTNAGGGDFTAARGYELSRGGPQRVRTAELDGDGDLDALVLVSDGPAILLLANDGGGRFTETEVLELPAGDEPPTDFAALDTDGDGVVDRIVVALTGFDELQVFPLPCTRGAAPCAPETVVVGRQPRGLAAGDLDKDGSLELVVALGEDRALQLLELDGGRFVTAGTTAVDGSPDSVWLADLDGDGDLDAAVTTSLAGVMSSPPDPDAKLLIVEREAGLFVPLESHALDVATESLAIGNFDFDSDLDIAVAQRSQLVTQLFLFTNQFAKQSELTFVPRRLETGTSPSNVLMHDVDGDGRADLLLPSIRGELLVALGDGRGGFPRFLPQDPGGMAMLSGLTSADYAEVDRDVRHLEDLLYVCPHAPMLWVAPNHSADIGP